MLEKLTDQIDKAKDTLFSFEILPPLKGNSIDSIYKGIDPLMEFKPAFVDVTYHREEFKIKDRPDGSFERKPVRKRPGTVAICAAIMHKYQIQTVPHLICGGFSREETENALIDLHFLGIKNVLALRGDNASHQKKFVPEADGNENALELIEQIGQMNKGAYLDEDLKNPHPTDFCIGAAGYPEKHIDAPNMQMDLAFLKRKIDAGAEFITTQMFFNNAKYFEFVDLCRAHGINVPIIPGIKPITKKAQLFALPGIFNIDIPDALSSEIDKCKDDKSVAEVGRDWCVEQSKELKAAGVPVIHYYTMGRSKSTYDVAKHVF